MKWTTLALAAAFAVLPVMTGCRTMAYTENGETAYELERRFNAWQTLVNGSIEQVYTATLDALQELKIDPITNEVDAVSGRIDALFADQMDLDIRLERVAPKLTRVSIRAGVLGDRDRALTIFREIEKKL